MALTTEARTITWDGISGRENRYEIFPIGRSFKALPGNYIFAKETSPGTFVPIYIGQTKNLSERFDDHHKMPCIKRNGATHIHVRINNGGENARLAEERDLIRRWNPRCNG